MWSAISAGGGAVGLLLGGVLTDLLSWEWVFLAIAPVAVGGAIAGLRYVPESRGDAQRGFDVAGAASVTGGLVLIVYATVRAQEAGWTAASTLGLFALGLA
nr:MFS transporter [Micromonospora sp. DSM 115978]